MSLLNAFVPDQSPPQQIMQRVSKDASLGSFSSFYEPQEQNFLEKNWG